MALPLQFTKFYSKSHDSKAHHCSELQRPAGSSYHMLKDHKIGIKSSNKRSGSCVSALRGLIQQLSLAIIFLYCTSSYANTKQGGSSLHEIFFHDPYLKMGMQLPITRRVDRYEDISSSDFHDKPSFRPFYLIGVGNKFKYINVGLEGFYLNAPSKSSPHPSIISTTRFSAIGGFITVSLDIVQKHTNSVFIGGGVGISENVAHRVTWHRQGATNKVVAQAQRKIRPAFQVFVGIDHYFTENLSVEGVIKYMDLGKFTTKNTPPDAIYHGDFRSVSFNINFKYNFGRHKNTHIKRHGHPVYPTFSTITPSTRYKIYSNTTYRKPLNTYKAQHKLSQRKPSAPSKQTGSENVVMKTTSTTSVSYVAPQDQNMTKINFQTLKTDNNQTEINFQ